MRVTSSMYYRNLYSKQHNSLSNELFDVNKQISSGLKIQYAKDDVRTFTETMRLDNEVTTLTQIKKSVDNGYKFSNQSDTVMNDFTDSMNRMKTLFVNAANDVHSEASLDAISKELRGLESHLKNLANTSINGKYLFSGSAIDVKPIADDGTYMGNAFKMNATLGSNVTQQYNISGSELFLGEELETKRQVSTNVIQKNLTKMYPDPTDLNKDGIDINLTTEDTIRDLMGDIDNEIDEGNLKHHFYVRGTRSDGTAFNDHIKLSDDQSVSNLLEEIGKSFGNTPNVNVVNVTMNSHGQIHVEDKIKGSSKLDFNMIGATDFEHTAGYDEADIESARYGTKAGQITNLDRGETDFSKIIRGTSVAANSNLHIKEFVKSPFAGAVSSATNIDGLHYDKTEFLKDGSKLTSNVSQVLKLGNSFISPSTKISQVADLSQGKANTLNGTSLRLVGNVLDGGSYDVQIDFKDPISSLTKTVTTGDGTNEAMNLDFVVNGVTYSVAVPNAGVATTAEENAANYAKAINEAGIPYVEAVVNGVDMTINNYNTEAGFDLTVNQAGQSTLASTDDLGPAVGGSTFSFDSDGDGSYDEGTYDIFDMSNPRKAVEADNMTYQQLMDVMNMVITDNIPATDNTFGDKVQEAIDYDTAIAKSKTLGGMSITYDGKLQFKDMNSNNTKANIAMFDVNSGDFSADASALTFNVNNAIEIRDSKTDFFKKIDQIISAVEENKTYPDSSRGGDMRNIGIQNALTVMDDLSEHINKIQTTIGANSNSLSITLERTEILEVQTKTLRSSVIDTDLAEASLKLSQLSLNYEAMLSTVGKVSKLSLVNYL